MLRAWENPTRHFFAKVRQRLLDVRAKMGILFYEFGNESVEKPQNVVNHQYLPITVSPRLQCQ